MRALTKSELINRVFERHPGLTSRDADMAVNEVLRTMVSAMSHGVRVEIRGFGSFSLKYREAREGAREVRSVLPGRQGNPRAAQRGPGP